MPRVVHFLRHAETRIDEKTPVTEWRLTKQGVSRAQNFAVSGVFDSVDNIFSSDEPKALLTAAPIAKRIGTATIAIPEFRELDRGTRYLTDDEYQRSVSITLNAPHSNVEGWESKSDALRRFERGLSTIESQYVFKEALIVSHGLILSIYFAHLLGVMDVYSRWKSLGFCAWGTVRNGRIVKDIASE
ncbi:MAG: histidine phosphatase family protein [Candidatus Thorarchaeota archaeon]